MQINLNMAPNVNMFYENLTVEELVIMYCLIAHLGENTVTCVELDDELQPVPLTSNRLSRLVGIPLNKTNMTLAQLKRRGYIQRRGSILVNPAIAFRGDIRAFREAMHQWNKKTA